MKTLEIIIEFSQNVQLALCGNGVDIFTYIGGVCKLQSIWTIFLNVS